MKNDDETGPVITYQFFASVSAKDRSYLCDFHKLSFADGAIQYRVFLQTLNHKDIVADLAFNQNEGWRIIHSTEPVSADIEWKLIAGIVKNTAG